MFHSGLFHAARYFGERIARNTASEVTSVFATHVRRLADKVEVAVSHLDNGEQVALLELSGEVAGYTVCVAVMADGRTLLQLMSRSSWLGLPPQIAHTAAARLDASSTRVKFVAKQLDSGRSKIVGTAVVGTLGGLTVDQFMDVTSEMAFKMRLMDQRLTVTSPRETPVPANDSPWAKLVKSNRPKPKEKDGPEMEP